MKPDRIKNVYNFRGISPLALDFVRVRSANLAHWRTAFAEGDL